MLTPLPAHSSFFKIPTSRLGTPSSSRTRTASTAWLQLDHALTWPLGRTNCKGSLRLGGLSLTTCRQHRQLPSGQGGRFAALACRLVQAAATCGQGRSQGSLLQLTARPDGQLKDRHMQGLLLPCTAAQATPRLVILQGAAWKRVLSRHSQGQLAPSTSVSCCTPPG